MTTTTPKEGLAAILTRHHVTPEELARAARVDAEILVHMQEGTPVPEGIATHVLGILGTLAGCPDAYTPGTVEVALVSETVFQSEVARMLAEIDTQTEAMMAGFYGISQGSSRHDVISTKWEALIASHLPTLIQANQTNEASQTNP